MYTEQILNLKCAITGLQFKQFHPDVQKYVYEKIKYTSVHSKAFYNLRHNVLYFYFLYHLADYIVQHKYPQLTYRTQAQAKEIILSYDFINDCPTDEFLILLATERI